MVCVLTHVDTVPEHLAAEAVEAVAADLGVAAGQIAAVCAQWGRLANLEGVAGGHPRATARGRASENARCIRQIRKEQDEDKILRQISAACGWPADGSSARGDGDRARHAPRDAISSRGA